MIRKVYETDPLLCPSCGAEMKIITFIEDHKVIDKIIRHLNDFLHGRGAGRIFLGASVVVFLLWGNSGYGTTF